MDDNMPDSNADRHLFKVLGALGSDVKHSLSLLERSRQDNTQLRIDMKQDTNDLKTELIKAMDVLRQDHSALSDRVDKLETFQTKIMAWAAVLIPLALVLGQAIAPIVLGIIQGG